MHRRQIVAGLPLAALGLDAPAQKSPASIERPTYSIGDTWTFDRRSSGRNVGGIHTQIISERTADDGFRVGVQKDGAPHSTPFWLYTADFNIIFVVQGERTVDQWVSFPMQVGATWESKYVPGRGQTARHKSRVVEQGRARTQAGEFDAFHIKASGNWFNQRYLPSIADGYSQLDYWYAPAAKRVVLFKIRNWRHAGVGSEISYEESWELLEYKLA